VALLTHGIAATDVAPSDMLISGMDSFPTTAGAGDNEVGADLVLAGGIGQHLITLADWSLAGTDTIVLTVGSVSTGVAVTTATTLRNGTDFTCATSNEVSAGLIATAINDAAIGVTAVATGAVVNLTPAATTFSLSLAETGTFSTVTNAADGGPVMCNVRVGLDVGRNTVFSTIDTAYGIGFDTGSGQFFVGGYGSGSMSLDTSGNWVMKPDANKTIMLKGGDSYANLTIGQGTATASAIEVAGTWNAASLGIKSVTELHTLTAAGTSVTTAAAPAGCRVLYVVCRVTTEIAGCTTFTAGPTGGAPDLYGTGIALTAGTTMGETDATADPQTFNTAAQTVTFTAAGGAASFSAGVIRVTIFYLDPTAPGS